MMISGNYICHVSFQVIINSASSYNLAQSYLVRSLWTLYVLVHRVIEVEKKNFIYIICHSKIRKLIIELHCNNVIDAHCKQNKKCLNYHFAYDF